MINWISKIILFNLIMVVFMSGIVLEIASTKVDKNDYDFTDEKTGKQVKGTTYKQAAYVHGIDKYAQAMELSLQNETPLFEGMYEILPSSFEVYKGRLQLKKKLELQPMKNKA